MRAAFVERTRTRFVTVRAGAEAVVVDARAHLGRVLEGDGVAVRFSGPPPAWTKLRLDEPPSAEHLDLATAHVTAIARRQRARVTFSSHASVRATVREGACAPPLRLLDVWAMTAAFEANGGILHLGWSGRSSALPHLAPIASTIDRLRASLARATPLDAATVPAVLSPQAAAVLLHEAVGHVVEAAATRSCVDARIASELVSISDDPTCENGPGTYAYDDDNVAALGPLTVVRDGVVRAELHSLASAREAGELPTANGRAASVWDPPIPRVANLLCHPGTSSLETLLDDAGDGIYVHHLANGVNNGCCVQADVVLAERIVRGRLSGRMLTGARIDETADVAFRISGVGRDAAWNANAMCGKAGQLLFNVGSCAPALRLTSLRFAP